MTKIAVLKCDQNLPIITPGQDTLEKLYIDFFAQTNVELTFYESLKGELPQDPTTYDGVLITGSKHSVLDNTAWMQNIEKFIRSNNYKKLIGICFGHQLISKSLGGTIKTKQWHIGVDKVDFLDNISIKYIEDKINSFNIRFSHQDYVIKLPQSAQRIGSNNLCPNCFYHIDNKILSMQFHPEFTLVLQQKILKERYKSLINPTVYEQATNDITLDTDHKLVLKWILQFIKS